MIAEGRVNAWRRLSRVLARTGAGMLLVLLLYAGATLLGAVVARSGEEVGPRADGIDIHVLSNGFHTDIAVPVVSDVHDWRPLLERPAFPPVARHASHVAFGWGSRAAYARLGTLADLTPALAVKALAFDASALRVVPLGAIRDGPGVRRVRLSPEGYAALARAVEAAFARDWRGEPQPLAGISHGLGGVFFQAKGRFSFVRGCNVWTGDVLRRAGVTMGWWTPFAQSVFWGLPRNPTDRP
jgi:uncharacterized protein (TIGR02117 family)